MENGSLLIIVSSAPYNGSDTVWNSLRLADTALGDGVHTRIFLINEGVDTARENAELSEGQYNLLQMLRDLASRGAEIKYCKTCVERCGIGEGQIAQEISAGSMKILYDWTMKSDRSVTF